ncbi:hypothetical protein [Yersinia proxima]|nr:hypothetical protein [Yersinia proxima]
MMIEAKKLADLMNMMFKSDPLAVESIISSRVIVNEVMASSDCPIMLGRDSHGVLTVGTVGILNGLAAPGTGYLAAIYGDDKQLSGFTVVGCKECEPYQYEQYHL